MAQKQIAPTTQIIKIPIKAESMATSWEDDLVADTAPSSYWGGFRSPANQPPAQISSDQLQPLRCALVPPLFVEPAQLCHQPQG
jgi:hypothetical protein